MTGSYVLFINAADTSRHTSSANTAIYPNLGLLTLMSSLKGRLRGESARLGYFDGTVYGNDVIASFIDDNASSISILCFSALTSNYGASLALAKRCTALNSSTVVIFGNDHFSALYNTIMTRQPTIDFGFYGNDVVEGFARFVTAVLGEDSTEPLSSYPGLVYRDDSGRIIKNSEDPSEYGRLPLIDYSLVDTLMPHQSLYLDGQQKTYFFMRERKLRSQVIDIGRGCIKFSGDRLDNIPLNACDFCGIIPGGKAITSPKAPRAWDIIKNAFDMGFNYLYVTADELPLTLWPLLRDMSTSVPDWFLRISDQERPKMFGYARAEAFAVRPDRVEVLLNVLGFDHFFVGFDGLSETSLLVMNKQPVGERAQNLMEHNLQALEKIAGGGKLLTAGIVVTHLGITPAIMEENFQALSTIVERYPRAFAALDFGPLCPIPGSLSFRYLTHPDYAEEKARHHGLRIDRGYLESIQEHYRTGDEFDMDDLVRDFVLGCAPEISPALVDEYMARTADLATKHGIVVGGGV